MHSGLLEAEVMLLVDAHSSGLEPQVRQVMDETEKGLTTALLALGKRLKEARLEKARAFTMLLDEDEEGEPDLDVVRSFVKLMFGRAAELDAKLNSALLSSSKPPFTKQELKGLALRYGRMVRVPEVLEEKLGRIENRIRMAAFRPERRGMGGDAQACMTIGRNVRSLRRMYFDIARAAAILHDRRLNTRRKRAP